MVKTPASPLIEEWLVDIRNFISDQAPELLTLFEVYSVEARFGRQYIDADLQRLPPGAQVLEIGAGALLLSCQLVKEGFDVTALEPIGVGFSHFNQMRNLVLKMAQQQGCLPNIINLPAEDLSVSDHFDFAFSINVMEHVRDVGRTISNVGASLKLNAIYRFTCPNYLFPYEPHFNSVTLFSKRLTEKVLGKRLFNNPTLPDPRGTWESLNWINVLSIRKELKKQPRLRPVFNRRLLASTFERVVFDREFASRRSSWMRMAILALVRLRLHYLAILIPAACQPIIDCMVIRTMPKEF